MADKTLPPHPPTPSPTRGEGEPEFSLTIQSPSPALGEGFRVRAINFCQSIRRHDVVKTVEGRYVYTVELMRRWVKQRQASAREPVDRAI